jgi:hypothetical protein
MLDTRTSKTQWAGKQSVIKERNRDQRNQEKCDHSGSGRPAREKRPDEAIFDPGYKRSGSQV